MKHLPVIACVLLLSVNLHAQNKKIDSLNQLIAKAQTDTARINYSIQKLRVVSNINLDSGISLSKKILEETKKAKYYKGEVLVRQKLITNYCFKGNYKEAEDNLKYLEKFIDPSKDSTDLSNIYANYGMMYGMQSKYDTSILFYEKAIGIEERLNDVKSLSDNYSNLAISYQQQSNFPRALMYQQKALKLGEQQKNEVSQAYTLTNMAITYENIGDTSRAEETYLKGLALAKKNDLANVELYIYTNLSTLYTKQSKWNKGYEFGMKAATLGQTMGDQGIQAASLAKAAISLAHISKFEEAGALSKQAMAVADSSAQPLNISQAYGSMGNIFFLQQKYAEAIPFYEKGFAAMKGVDIYDIGNSIAYKDLSACYEKTGNYVKALANYKTAASIADSVKSKDNIRKATELTMNYEFNKKQEIQLAQKQKEDELTRTKQTALIAGLILMLILAAVAFNAYRNKQKANALLEKQKQQIETTLNELRATQKHLIQSEKMASLGELTAGIAHEIQNPLNFVNNFAEVNGELVEEIQENMQSGNHSDAFEISHDIKQNSEKILHHGKRADAIVKSMLQHSRTSSNQKEPANINSLAEEYLRLSYHGMRAKDKVFNAKLETEFDLTLPPVNIVYQDIGRVLLNLLTNAFYAVNEQSKKADETYEPTVAVTTKKVYNNAVISVKDNGTGIPANVAEKIFQPFFTTKPTGQGTGLGLSISYDIIKAHNGTLKLENEEGKGAEFIIHLPLQL